MTTDVRSHLLSDRQRRILDYVTLLLTRDDKSPTLREIAEACDVSSTSVAAYNLDKLVERGLLVRIGQHNDTRSLRLPVNPWRQLVEDADWIFGLLDGLDLPAVAANHIALFRERRARLIRG
jgi:AcrR family transcriptional regulator